jgi:phosphoribosylanthranilate isomerase
MKKKRFWDIKNSTVKVKACGVLTDLDVIKLSAMGYDALGFHFFTMKDKENRIDNCLKMLKVMPHDVHSVLLVAFNKPDQINEILDALHVDTLQLYTDLKTDDIEKIFLIDSSKRGGSGEAHDWELSKKINRLSKKPIILAGGLTSNNVSEAIKKVQPTGVDVESGISCIINGQKRINYNKAYDFIIAIRENLADIQLMCDGMNFT